MLHLIFGLLKKDILLDILNTPISPELLPPDEAGEISQLTEEKIGPYELHDFFLFHHLRNGYKPKKIFSIAKETFKDDYTEEEILKNYESNKKRYKIILNTSDMLQHWAKAPLAENGFLESYNSEILPTTPS